MGAKSRGILRAAVVTGALLVSGLVSPAANAAVYVDGTPEPAWRTNGVVFATVIVGDTLVVGGNFTDTVSPTGQHVARRNLAAFSLSTGALLPGWQADADDIVRALATDGTNVYAGGYFTHVAGQGRLHIAKLDAASGALDGQFAPTLSNAVRAIWTDGTSVVAGGMFTVVNGTRGHARLVKLSAADGSIDAQFNGSASKAVWALTKSPTANVLYAGGQFDLLSGVAREGAGAVDYTTGAVVGPPLAGSPRPTIGLDISPDGTLLYGALVSNTCIAWRTNTGNRAWGVRTQGNVQAVRYFDGSVYCGFHDSFQNDDTIKLVAANATTGAVDPDFRPAINTFLGVRAIDASPAGLVIGGNFTNVSGVAARGFAIFRP